MKKFLFFILLFSCTVTTFSQLTVSSPTLVSNKYGIMPFHSSWMQDPLQTDGAGKVWIMKDYYPNSGPSTLVEYTSIANLQSNNISKTYTLPFSHAGTGGVVYGGNFYYTKASSNTLVKYDLSSESVSTTAVLPNAGFMNSYAYQWGGFSDIDFAIDENGLWVLYSTLANSGRLVVSKLDPNTMAIIQTWNTNSELKTIMGDAFIIDGIVYCVDEYWQANNTINYKYNTNTSTGSAISIPITFLTSANYPYVYITQVTYNPQNSKLYVWGADAAYSYQTNGPGSNQNISTTISQTVFCQGASINVNYTANGSYTAGNIFTAQLSDAAGSFSSPTNLGNVSSTTSGSISVTIPIATTPGTGYRIRVISSNPSITGSDNGSNITVQAGTTYYRDADEDGFGNLAVTMFACSQPEGYVSNSTDCNDNNDDVHPGATEICNDIDDDCDGSVDEGFINTVVTCPFTGTVSKNLQSGCTYTVNGTEFNATVSQNCGPLGYTLTGATTGAGTSLAGVQLKTGTTNVTWSATNANDQSFTCSFNVYVVPAPPSITCPTNIVVPATNGQCGAVVNYTTPVLPNLCTNYDNLPPTTQTFNYTGQIINWTVPNGVTKISVEAWGAEGGKGQYSFNGVGGKGGYSKGDIDVTPGEILYIVVGGKGGDFSQTPGSGAGGYNGGGVGDLNGYNEAGGGGGASDIRKSGNTLLHRTIVAGGGGGAGWSGNGGDGGGVTGNNGLGSLPVQGGTQVNGGLKGSDLCAIGISGGSNGSLGIGGNGANGGCGSGGGGGGAGGYYGGGGGGTQSGNLGSGGGGGSSYIGSLNNSSTQSGIRFGNGLITITYGSSLAGVTQTAGLPSGSNFPVGITTNTFQITDAFGQTNTCSFTVTVNDEQAPTVTQPNNITIGNVIGDCSASVNFSATATDNCSVTSLKYYLNYNTPNQEEISFPKTFAVGNYVVTVVARDAANNTTTKTFTITVNDVSLPTFTCPQNQNVELNATCNLVVPDLISELIGSDNCGTVTFTQSPSAGSSLTSSHNQTHNVSITANDGNGNTQTCTVVLTGKDVTKPTFTCLSNQNVDLNATCKLVVPDLIATLTGSDNCGTVTFTQSPIAGASLSSSHNQTHDVLITASDGNGNTRTCTVVLTGKDVTKPTFTCPTNANVDLNATCKLVVPDLIGELSGLDNCGTVTFTQSPSAGSSLTSSHNQTHNVLITANDGNGNTQTCTVVLTGKDVTKPTFTCPTNANLELNATCKLVVPDLISELMGRDNCGTVTFTQSPSAGASLSSSHNQTHSVLITANDGNGNTQTCTVVLTGKDVTKPTFICPQNQNVELNATCKLIVPDLIGELIGSDNCGTVTFTQSPVAGASLSSSHNQTHNVLITANDGNGNTQTCTVVLTGKDVTKPTFSCPSNRNVDLNATCQLIVPNLIAGLIGSDNCGNVTFTQSPVADASLPSSHNQTHNVLITASDGNGNTQTCTVVLTGKDVTKPIFSCPSNRNVDLNATCQLIVPNLIAGLTGSDNCGTVTFTQNPVAGAAFSLSHNQTQNVVITANDGNGNTQTCTVVLTAKDVTLPVITCPSAKTISCAASILPANTGNATATDNCGGNPVITYNDVSGQNSNPANAGYYNYTITRTWKAEDAAGNTNTCNQIITVQDITDPDITCPADKLSIPFDFGQLYATIVIGTATATDNCAANANISIAGTRSDNVVISNLQYPLGQTTVAWTATDPSDNSDECTQTITVRKRNTVLTYTGDVTDNKIVVQYSDIINLQAKLTDNEGLLTPNNISGRTITFQLLSGTTVVRSETVTTNANGIAIDTFKVEQAPGAYSVKTIFAGDSYFNGSNDQDNCEVKQEDAIVEYNGSQYFTTASSTTLTGSITVAASLNDIDDGSDKRGDIRKAKATFRDGGPGGIVIGSANLPVGLVNPGVLTNGLSATTQNNITLNSNEASSGGKIFQVWVGASDHYTGADAGPTPVTLALPGQDFVTGGGHLVVTNSAGTYAGTPNSKMNFGFTMKWNKSGKNLQGNINIVFRKWQLYNGVWQWRVYQAKSNAINSMAVVEVGANGQPVSGTNPAAFRKAIINTKANLKDVTDPLANIDLGGNHNLTLDALDHITANGGISDKISVTLMGATTNELLFSSSWSSNATQSQTITGGNINVRNASGSGATTRNTVTKNAEMESQPAKDQDDFVVKAYPNPTEHRFTFVINTSLNETVQIQIYDAVGRKMQTLSARANELIQFGEKLKVGVYFAEVIQGSKRQTVKLIKQ
jgi:hypothetical protein